MIIMLYIAALILGLVFLAILYWKDIFSTKNPIPRKILDFETAEEIMPPEFNPPKQGPPQLPDCYEETRLVLLVRDPEWLFAYWDIDGNHWHQLTAGLGENISPDNLTLRVYEIANNMDYFDIKVGGLSRDWHIRVGKSNTPFYCQLGIKTCDRFIPIAISNTVVTPRNQISASSDEEWMLVSDNEQRLLKRIGQFPLDLSSPLNWGE
ncbi:MAG: DUF4912 domain-containing protein [Syntrophomonadaceae bacterium]|nr:DUF4912 domain-containing protein [Syntrophomonadaceae bacterium]